MASRQKKTWIMSFIEVFAMFAEAAGFVVTRVYAGRLAGDVLVPLGALVSNTGAPAPSKNP